MDTQYCFQVVRSDSFWHVSAALLIGMNNHTLMNVLHERVGEVERKKIIFNYPKLLVLASINWMLSREKSRAKRIVGFLYQRFSKLANNRIHWLKLEENLWNSFYIYFSHIFLVLSNEKLIYFSAKCCTEIDRERCNIVLGGICNAMRWEVQSGFGILFN